MANCETNKPIADAFIVAMYPEIVDLETVMDNILAKGRLKYSIVLEDLDHAEAVMDDMTNQVGGLGYTITQDKYLITVAC